VPLVQLEHPVRDFETWKAAFDSDPIRREASGVRRYEIYRPIDDPNYIAVDLEFDDRAAAEAFKVALENLWRSPQAAPALGGTPRVRIVDMVEGFQY
jgi:quinol monooxygenase YgiN